MNRDSKPEEFVPPSFEEVVEYAKENNFIKAIDVKKFYEYYGRTGFVYRGLPMDWKGKMAEWARTERKQFTKPTASIVEAKPLAGMRVEDIWKAVDRI